MPNYCTKDSFMTFCFVKTRNDIFKQKISRSLIAHALKLILAFYLLYSDDFAFFRVKRIQSPKISQNIFFWKLRFFSKKHNSLRFWVMEVSDDMLTATNCIAFDWHYFRCVNSLSKKVLMMNEWCFGAAGPCTVQYRSSKTYGRFVFKKIKFRKWEELWC